MASGKLAFHHVSSAENQGIVSKRKSLRSSVALGSQFKSTNVSDVQRVSDLLAGKEFCVFTGFDDVKKSDVERKIIEFGGTFVQNPGKNTFCVLAESDSTTRIKNVISSGLYDVIKTSWFFSQLKPEKNYLPQFKPQNFLATSLETRENLAKSFDAFGDHFTQPLTKETLQHVMEACDSQVLSNDEKYQLDLDLFCDISPYGVFRLCTAYFDRFPIIDDPCSGLLSHLELYEFDFKFFGGKCSDRISDETTHVVVFSGDLARLEEFNRRNSKRDSKFRIVTENWLLHSIKNKSLNDGFDFL